MLRILKKYQQSSFECPFSYLQRLKMSTAETINIKNNTENIVDENVQESLKRPLNQTENENTNDTVGDETKPKIAKFERIKKRNFALMLGYLGKDYYGMQRNPQMRTIEEDLFRGLLKAKLIDEDAFDTIQNTHFQRAARTDKGVSATRQICSVKLPEYSKIEDINEHLPKQIRVFGLKRVTKGFNSKSKCNARTYTYTLPTYAFASENSENLEAFPTDEYIEKRIEQLQTIDGKPYNEYRINPEVLDKLNSVLKWYEGSHNFHNFTSKVRPYDPRAMRYMMKCDCNSIHITDGMEFATISIKGQSFMLHQIRKMVGLAIGVVRNVAPMDIIEETFNHDKRDIPIAPSLGLVLNHVHYDTYDRRYGSDGIHGKLKWEECDEEVEKFHKDFILRHIEETELKDQSMLRWIAELSHKFCRVIDLQKEGTENNVEDGDEQAENENEEDQKSESASQ